MKGWLLDTNVLSELRRPRPEPEVVAFVSEQPLDTLFISVATLAEIRFGIEKLDDGARRQQILSWLDREMRPLFDGRVLPLSEEVMLRWRLILEDGRRRDIPSRIRMC